MNSSNDIISNHFKPVVLIILDGWGYSDDCEFNAVSGAKAPNLCGMEAENPVAMLEACGEAVGLPRGQMGNSEAGHLNIGAGRPVYAELTRIDRDIQNGSFYHNRELITAINHAKKTGGYLHLMGLLSDGGVHSSIEHLFAILKLAKENDLHKVLIHAFLDGRDTPPRSAERYIVELGNFTKEIGVGEIALICGRYYAMDRDARWERTKIAFDAIVYGIGETASDPIEAVLSAYVKDEDDEFVMPTIIQPVIDRVREEKKIAGDKPILSADDSVIFFNFRPDRARQITRSLISENFDEFSRGNNFELPYFVSFTQYKDDFHIPVAFKPQDTFPGLGEIISKKGLKQVRIAETEKYAHVTFFFNGGIEEPLPGEDRVLVPSPKVETYDLQPEMSAFGIRDEVLNALDSNKYDLVVINFANLDMVGHTGNYEATVKAMEVVDSCVGVIVGSTVEKGGACLITADHGNAEQMVDMTSGQPHTSHGMSSVKLILVGAEGLELQGSGVLADIAPTILGLMNIKASEFMTGKNLLKVRAV